MHNLLGTDTRRRADTPDGPGVLEFTSAVGPWLHLDVCRWKEALRGREIRDEFKEAMGDVPLKPSSFQMPWRNSSLWYINL